MTPWEKLAWLQIHAHETHIEINPQRGVYESIEQYTSRDDVDPVDKALVAEAARRGHLVVVQCYPQTPIGFYRQPHYDLGEAIGMIYEMVHRELVPTQAGGDGT